MPGGGGIGLPDWERGGPGGGGMGLPEGDIGGAGGLGETEAAGAAGGSTPLGARAGAGGDGGAGFTAGSSTGRTGRPPAGLDDTTFRGGVGTAGGSVSVTGPLSADATPVGWVFADSAGTAAPRVSGIAAGGASAIAAAPSEGEDASVATSTAAPASRPSGFGWSDDSSPGAFAAGAFAAGAFAAGAFAAGAFAAGAFLAGAFLAGAFLAGAFLAGAFLAGFSSSG